jgi:hypothetical protein
VSFEQYWTVPARSSEDVVAAVRGVADPHQLTFRPVIEDDRITIAVTFPVGQAADLAAAFSDLYDVEEAASQLDELEGDVDMEAATRAGVVTTRSIGTTQISTIDPDDVDRFRKPAPTHYSCQLEIIWTEDPPVVVSSNDADNRAGWPTIVAFADAVVERLGGGWVEA